MTDEMIEVMVAFMRYSLEPIDYKYGSLTDTEKTLCSEEEFNEMVQYLKSLKG